MQKLKHAVEIWRRQKDLLRASTTVVLITLFPITIALPDRVAAQTTIELHSFSAQEPKPSLLEFGKPIERGIASGESRSYLIALKAGEFLRLSVEQINIDVVIVVRSPQDRTILEMDNQFAISEVIAIVAQQSGDYRVEVRSKTLHNGVGKYVLKVEAIRLPLQTDLALVSAIHAYRDGIGLQQQKTAQSYPQAIKLYEAAREGFRKVNEAIFEAETLKSMSDSYSSLGKNEEAINYLKLALAILQPAGHEFGKATILGDIGFAYLSLGNYQKALESFDSALKLWIKLNNARQRAIVTGKLGVTYQRLGNMDEAEGYFHLSLGIFDQLNTPSDFDRAVLLNDFGWFHYIRSNPKEAFNYYSQALSVFESLDAKKEAASVLSNVAIAYKSIGEANLAIETYKKALQFKRDVGDRLGEAIMLNNLGVAYTSIGDYQLGLSHYLQALPIHQEVDNRGDEAYTLSNIGALLDTVGESTRSISYQERAIKIAYELSDKRSEGNALNSLGVAHRRLGDLPKAMECFEQALAIRRKLGDAFQEATTLQSIGVVKAIQNKFQETLDYYQQALSIFRSRGNRPNQANVLILIGNVYVSLSSVEEATKAYLEALFIAKDIKSKSKEAEALHRLARVEVKRGNFDKARSLIEDAIQIIETSRNTITNQQLKAAYFSTVREFYEVYLNLLMQMYKRSGSPELLAKAFEVSEKTRSRSLVELIRESNIDITEGIDKHSKEREESLRQRIKDKNEIYVRLSGNKDTAELKDSLQKEVGELSVQYEEVLAEIRARSSRYADLTQRPQLSLAEVQQRILDKDTLLLEYSLDESHSYLWVVSSDAVTSFELAGRLQIEDAAERFKKLMKDYQESSNENFVAIQKRQANADRELPVVLEELSKLVLEPAAHLLGNKRLLIVPDGALHYVPFAVLPESRAWRPAASVTGEVVRHKLTTGSQESNLSVAQAMNRAQPLIVNHEIISLPSASVLDLIKRETQGRKVPRKKVAVFADPVFDERDARITLPVRSGQNVPKDSIEMLKTERAVKALRDTAQGLPRLVFSREQAEAICAMVPESVSMSALGFAATRNKVLEKKPAGNYHLGDYSFVHFATHGILNAEQPELSGIVLSLVDEQGNPQDGFLGLSDIFNMKLPVELVVLSGCETGLGKNINGEGLVGLTRGFMYAGAKRVVASLWKVEDYSTSEFMKKFYEKMLKKTKPMRPAEALQATQIEMWENGKKPHQWAAFVIQGEWK